MRARASRRGLLIVNRSNLVSPSSFLFFFLPRVRLSARRNNIPSLAMLFVVAVRGCCVGIIMGFDKWTRGAPKRWENMIFGRVGVGLSV